MFFRKLSLGAPEQPDTPLSLSMLIVNGRTTTNETHNLVSANVLGDNGPGCTGGYRAPLDQILVKRKLIMGHVSHQRSLLKRYQWQTSRFGLENADPEPRVTCRFCSGSLIVLMASLPTTTFKCFYSGIVLTKVTLTFISIHFMFGIKVDVLWHKITLLTLFFCCCCLFVLFCFLLSIHKIFTQIFRFVFYKMDLQAGSVREEQNSAMDAQKT